MDHYLLIIYGDVEPGIVGPFATDEERLEAARRHRRFFGLRDNIFRLDAEGEVEVDMISTTEMET